MNTRNMQKAHILSHLWSVPQSHNLDLSVRKQTLFWYPEWAEVYRMVYPNAFIIEVFSKWQTKTCLRFIITHQQEPANIFNLILETVHWGSRGMDCFTKCGTTFVVKYGRRPNYRPVAWGFSLGLFKNSENATPYTTGYATMYQYILSYVY